MCKVDEVADLTWSSLLDPASDTTDEVGNIIALLDNVIILGLGSGTIISMHFPERLVHAILVAVMASNKHVSSEDDCLTVFVNYGVVVYHRIQGRSLDTKMADGTVG